MVPMGSGINPNPNPKPAKLLYGITSSVVPLNYFQCILKATRSTLEPLSTGTWVKWEYWTLEYWEDVACTLETATTRNLPIQEMVMMVCKASHETSICQKKTWFLILFFSFPIETFWSIASNKDDFRLRCFAALWLPIFFLN